MPVYRFELSGNIEDGNVDVELADDEAARLDATRAACEAMVWGYHLNAANWEVRVFDPAGSTIATITFTNAMNREENSPPIARPSRSLGWN